MAYFEMVSQNFPGVTKKYHGKTQAEIFTTSKVEVLSMAVMKMSCLLGSSSV